MNNRSVFELVVIGHYGVTGAGSISELKHA